MTGPDIGEPARGTAATPDEKVGMLLEQAATHFDEGPKGVDGFFEAMRQFGEIVAAQRAARRQEVRDNRNARRRARYRARPRPPARPPAAVLVEDDVYEPECRCHVVPMPPCSWCENGGVVDEDSEN